MSTRFIWHDYRYYPYEKELASREITALLSHSSLHETDDGLELDHHRDFEALTYFAGFANGSGFVETTQSRLERVGQNGRKRQATRYSVHGLHEYKGKFNPQVARAILNIFGVRAGQRVLDPFCGSGTTLAECAHIGAEGCGIDVNPLAVFVANAKLQALATPAEHLREVLDRLAGQLKRRKRWATVLADDARSAYLKKWFDLVVLQKIEIIGSKIMETTGPSAPFFLVVTSNLLRDYSLQDPSDLRIRRRKSPLPEIPFEEAFLSACKQAIDRLAATQQVLGTCRSRGRAELFDIRSFEVRGNKQRFDAAITSPPYAMALPYIDTQRLSLVWLKLLQAAHVLQLEAELIGSREMRGPDRRSHTNAINDNAARLPENEALFCAKLNSALGTGDGFRRKAVPILLYRYFAAMQASFYSIRAAMKPSAPYALIVGHNHTVLGGTRYDIDTPSHLSSLAQAAGWQIDELIPLQTYRRYGLHASNAVEAETLILLRNRQ